MLQLQHHGCCQCYRLVILYYYAYFRIPSKIVRIMEIIYKQAIELVECHDVV